MEYYISQICLFAFNFTPRGFMPCDGSVLQIAQYQALYALIGNQYGGDGRTTFALPDLRGKSPLDKDATEVHYHMCAWGVFPSRN